MKLCYRGIGYERTFQVELIQTGDRPISGKYRGSVFQLNSSTVTPRSQMPQTLTYRGATYSCPHF